MKIKKTNRKGFTLVELLAVIIILAIVVGITIPAVLTTTNRAKERAFENAAQTAANWIDRQYEIARSGLGGTEFVTVNSMFVEACGTDGTNCLFETNENDKTMYNVAINQGVEYTNGEGFISATGLSEKNVYDLFFAINQATGKSCVVIFADSNSDYYTSSGENYKTGGYCD